MWVVVVCHANLSMWAWLFYFLTYHSCPAAKQGGQLVHTGTGLMVVASVVCVIAAVTNDRYFPEARMSQKEAKAFFDHLKSARPRHTMLLKQRRLGVDFPVDTWTDQTSFPDLSEVALTGDMEVKLNLVTQAEDERTDRTFKRFITRTIAEYQVEGESSNYKLITSIPSRKVRVGPRHWNLFPAVKSDRKHRIYIFDYAKRPLVRDFFLRTAWIMNILACSGPVLAVFVTLRSRSVDCYIVKKYKVFQGSPQLDSSLLHDEYMEEREGEGLNPENNVPPSYSSLQLQDDLPTYSEAIADLLVI